MLLVVLVDDGGSDIGDVGLFSNRVEHERFERSSVGDCDVDEEVV